MNILINGRIYNPGPKWYRSLRAIISERASCSILLKPLFLLHLCNSPIDLPSWPTQVVVTWNRCSSLANMALGILHKFDFGVWNSFTHKKTKVMRSPRKNHCSVLFPHFWRPGFSKIPSLKILYPGLPNIESRVFQDFLKPIIVAIWSFLSKFQNNNTPQPRELSVYGAQGAA